MDAHITTEAEPASVLSLPELHGALTHLPIVALAVLALLSVPTGCRLRASVAPRLSGGRDLRRFRRKHGQGLFPAAIVSDQQFAAINTWLATNPAGGARTSAGG